MVHEAGMLECYGLLRFVTFLPIIKKPNVHAGCYACYGLKSHGGGEKGKLRPPSAVIATGGRVASLCRTLCRAAIGLPSPASVLCPTARTQQQDGFGGFVTA